MDNLTPLERSWNMSRIRCTNTSLELGIRRIVHGMGYRYRLHDRKLPGRPDIVFPKLNKIIQVHGCYWHPHARCSIAHVPKSRVDYWKSKLEGNRRRDTQNTRRLTMLGWQVLTVRECQTARTVLLVRRLKKFLQS